MKQFFLKKERGKFDDVCVNNFESLDKMDNFLGKGSLPSLTSSEAETFSKLISPGETEKTIKELLQKNHQDQMVSQAKSNKLSKTR